MKAVLFSLGSRGDIEPHFALGEILKDQGWDVVYVFPEQFRDMVEVTKSSFYGFTKEFLDVLLTGDQFKVISSRDSSRIKRLQTLLSLARKSIKINTEVTLRQKEIIELEQPDYVFYNQKCVYPVVWEFKNPGKGIFVHPFPCFLHKVTHHSIIGFGGGGNFGFLLNSLGYFIQSLAISVATYFSTKKFHKELIGKSISPLHIRKKLLTKTKSIYTISPSLFAEPSYWPENAHVVGYNERQKANNWQPDKALSHFLQTYQKITFITFGSISNTDPKKKTNAILNVLIKHRIPTIINTSWGGLIQPDNHPEHIYFLNNIPYDWIFPKVYAVVHHGGSGTTHSALKYGCANLVIPHFIDQFFWDKTVYNLGVRPKGVSIKKLNVVNFEKILLDLLKNKKYKIKAESIAENMENEKNVEELMRLILA